MPNLNRVELRGHLGKDATSRTFSSGAVKTTFTLATSEKWKDKKTGDWQEATDWHNVAFWGNEHLAEHLKKGVAVAVEGKLKTDKFDKKDGTQGYITYVNASEVSVLVRIEKPKDGSRPRPGPAQRHEALEVSDEDIPF